MTSALVTKGNVKQCSVLTLSALWAVSSGRNDAGGGGGKGTAGGRGTPSSGGTAGGGIGGGGGGGGTSLDLDFDTPCKGFNILRTHLPLLFLCHAFK